MKSLFLMELLKFSRVEAAGDAPRTSMRRFDPVIAGVAWNKHAVGVKCVCRVLPGLVNIQTAIETCHGNSGFTHSKW